jgi:hypothetical protein
VFFLSVFKGSLEYQKKKHSNSALKHGHQYYCEHDASVPASGRKFHLKSALWDVKTLCDDESMRDTCRGNRSV